MTKPSIGLLEIEDHLKISKDWFWGLQIHDFGSVG